MNQSYTYGHGKGETSSYRDRRKGLRFPLELTLNYRVGSKSAEWVPGRTINMSSSGILIQTDAVPLQGSKIQVKLTWPEKLNNQVPLRLVVQGQVVRSGRGEAAVVVQRFEFRTAPDPMRTMMAAAVPEIS